MLEMEALQGEISCF